MKTRHKHEKAQKNKPLSVLSQGLKRHWLLVLFAISVVGYLTNAYFFYPGYMSPDSQSQLCQAIHKCALSDWHPISMVLVWRTLINLTGGHIASMLMFQLAMLWLAVFLLALFVWKKTASRKWSFLPLLIPLLPNVLNISGVIWKDNQMAFALLLAFSVALVAKSLVKNKIAKIVLYIASLILIMYATTVRTNGAAAALPMAFLVFHMSGWTERSSYRVLASIGIVVFSLVLLSAANNVFQAEKGHTPGVMMSADVANTIPPQQISHTDTSKELKSALLQLSRCSRFDGNLNLHYWHCVDVKHRIYFTGSKYSELKSLWLTTIIHHPASYMGYKLEAYSQFLFSGDHQPAVWQNGMTSTKNTTQSTKTLSLRVKSISSQGINRVYTKDFGYKYFSFMYKAWFWLFIAVGLMIYALKNMARKELVITLSLSATLNILSFLPASETTDYRYIYWSAIACVIAVMLVAVDYEFRKNIVNTETSQK